MGNYVSCAKVKNKASETMTRVILPAGEVRSFYEPTKAAELMFENPSFFVVDIQSLQVGRRLSALGADEELEMGNVYAMFPMKRLNSVISAADMGVLFLIANGTAKKGGSSCGGGAVRVAPEEEEDGEKRLEEAGEMGSELKYRLSMCRSKKPMLETIVEEPVCSR
ncbi:hypothetical protein Droror1_Dr00011926 [Drosera rotundifolia]